LSHHEVHTIARDRTHVGFFDPKPHLLQRAAHVQKLLGGTLQGAGNTPQE
jgi:hypothetical protein